MEKPENNGMVDFCKKCDALVVGKRGDIIICSVCGTENKTETEVVLKENVLKKQRKQEVLKEEATLSIHPITNSIECPKCGIKKAYYWSKQTRASDEPETQFFKCIKCSHQWRRYH